MRRAHRLYNHLLMVLDDGEFYEEHGPKPGTGPGPRATAANAKGSNLSLSQVRAIVTSLNSLVFHTHLPRALPAKQQQQHHHHHRDQQGEHHKQMIISAVAACGEDATAMLTEAAPLLLRSLYERDARWVGTGRLG
eukprot:157332-Pelagomonas_calceolata.AAC.1